MCYEVKNTVMLSHGEASSHSSIFQTGDIINFVTVMLG